MSRKVFSEETHQTYKLLKRNRRKSETPMTATVTPSNDYAKNSVYANNSVEAIAQSTTPSGSFLDEHNYFISKPYVLDLQETIARMGPLCLNLQRRIKKLEKIIKSKDPIPVETPSAHATSSPERIPFCKWKYFRERPGSFKMFTGFDHNQFHRLLEFLRPTYYNIKASKTLSTHFHIPLALEDQLFFILCRLKLGKLGNEIIPDSFNISEATYDRIWELWPMVLHEQLARIPVWLKRQRDRSRMVILDCVNVGQIGKFLLAVRLDGVVVRVGNFYDRETTNAELVKESGILQWLEAGDVVFADDGFKIKPLLDAKGVLLKTSSSCHTRRIIERVICELRYFRILTLSGPWDVVRTWKVCCSLLNFKKGNFPR